MSHPNRSFRLLSTLVAVASLAATVIGCEAGPVEVPNGDNVETTTDDALSGSDAVSRAEEWVAVQLHYCQSPNGTRDYDAACSSYCNRYENPAWDAYRSDCSGLVSWAWGLPAPGRVTKQFAPFENDITFAIDASDLQPGDAVNNDEHVMLFKAWVNHGTRAVFIEEPGCSVSQPYAREITSDVSISGSSIHVSFNGMTFTAIRNKNVSGGGSAPAAGNCTADETAGAAHFGCSCADHHASGGFCDGTGCTAQETSNAAHFGCSCVDHQANGGYCPGTGCTAKEEIDASKFGCQCVDHQGNGGFCPGTGCTALETENAAKFGCQCVDHEGNGGFCPGTGCTALETEDAAKFGCQCVDHQGNGGYCPGSGCTAKETADAAKFGCGCVDHKAAGGFCPGTGCTAKETIDCSNAGQACSLHACVKK